MNPGDILATSASTGARTLATEVALVASQLRTAGDHAENSIARYTTEIARFVAELELRGIPNLAGIGADETRNFVEGAVPAGAGWADPAPATQHLRRSSVRLLFTLARQLHLVTFDPTLDLVLPPRSSLRTRPLGDDEELLGRIWSRNTLDATRLPAAWALGQATATANEIATARVEDLDLAAGRVHLRGSGNRLPRSGVLTDWGAEQLHARAEQITGPDTRMVYRGQRGTGAGGGWCSAIHDVLVLAGLNTERGVHPASLPGWAGRRAFEDSGRIEDAALALGLRSLDRAAEAIGWSWR